MGLSGIDVSDVEKSQRAIRTMDSYINYLNTERAMIGAYNNLTIYSEKSFFSLLKREYISEIIQFSSD